MEPVRLAVADIGLEGAPVLERCATAIDACLPKLRPRRFQHELVDHRFVLVDGAVDAVELLGREHVHREPLLELLDALLVLGLERFEGAHEVVEGDCHVVAGGAVPVPASPLAEPLAALVSIISVSADSLMSFLF